MPERRIVQGRYLVPQSILDMAPLIVAELEMHRAVTAWFTEARRIRAERVALLPDLRWEDAEVISGYQLHIRGEVEVP